MGVKTAEIEEMYREYIRFIRIWLKKRVYSNEIDEDTMIGECLMYEEIDMAMV
jgi:hypothetical protein